MTKKNKRKNGGSTYFSSVSAALFDFVCAAAETLQILSKGKKKRKR